MKSLSRVQLFATLWTAAHQAPLSMGFSRQEYWSGVPLPSSKGWRVTEIYIGSPLGSSIHEIFQTRILDWVAISFSRGSSPPRDQTSVSLCLLPWQVDSTIASPGKILNTLLCVIIHHSVLLYYKVCHNQIILKN